MSIRSRAKWVDQSNGLGYHQRLFFSPVAMFFGDRCIAVCPDQSREAFGRRARRAAIQHLRATRHGGRGL